MKNLGKLLYKKDFPTIVLHKNDGNGHLNNSLYPVYAEQIRVKFLESFGWSDEIFNKNFGVSMRIGRRETIYKKPLKERDRVIVGLDICSKKDSFFYMLYTFYTPSGEKAVLDKTIVGFVNPKTERVVNIPYFFLKEMKHH